MKAGAEAAYAIILETKGARDLSKGVGCKVRYAKATLVKRGLILFLSSEKCIL